MLDSNSRTASRSAILSRSLTPHDILRTKGMILPVQNQAAERACARTWNSHHPAFGPSLSWETPSKTRSRDYRNCTISRSLHVTISWDRNMLWRMSQELASSNAGAEDGNSHASRRITVRRSRKRWARNRDPSNATVGEGLARSRVGIDAAECGRRWC